MSQPSHQRNLQIKRHEDNIIFLQSELHRLGASILDLQENGTIAMNENGATPAEEEETEQILRHEKSAASLLCRLKLFKSHHATQSLNLALTKDVLGIVGIVATLGRVDDDKLSRTYEAVKVLEKYDANGTIISNAGIHGLGSSIGKSIKGRFLIICLDDLSPYAGDFVVDDPQRKLALRKPQLPDGECPPGFLDYAVNRIKLDSKNLACVTSGGDGLRETLFHTLFSRLQIYSTRAEMLLALPCINDGAVSLDGGIIKKSGVFVLGDRKDLQVKFPVTYEESSMPQSYAETDNLIKKLKWERTHVTEDMQREQELLGLAKANLTGTSVIP